MNAEVPVRNLAGGIERSFKFCHINIGYEPYRLLVNQDLTPRAPAIRFSAGAPSASTWWVRQARVRAVNSTLPARGDLVAVLGLAAVTATLFASARPLSWRRLLPWVQR